MNWSLGLMNLPEWLTELRETFYLLDVTQEQPEGRDAQGRACGKGRRASLLSRQTTPSEAPWVHQPGSSLNPLLLRFMEDSLQHHDCFNLQPRDQGCD